MKTYLSICIALALTLLACEGTEDSSSAPLVDPNVSREANAAALRRARIRSEFEANAGRVDTTSDNGDRTTHRRDEETAGQANFQYGPTSEGRGAQTTIEYLNSTDRRIVVNAQTEILLTKRSNGAWLLQLVDCQTGTTFKTSFVSNTAGTMVAPSYAPVLTRGPARVPVAAICHLGTAGAGAEVGPQHLNEPPVQEGTNPPVRLTGN